MEVEYLRLVKIDHENNVVVPEPIETEGNVHAYIMSIIDEINNNDGDRQYEFKPGELSMKTFLGALIEDNNREEISLSIANRLLSKEATAQTRYHQITEIQKGILLVAYCHMFDNEYKIVLCKADYTEFIEEATGQKRNGLPTKKKIFKSFCANVTSNAGAYAISKMVTFDVNSSQTKYWYDEFLDLKACLDDTENTERAFRYIEAKILRPLRAEHPREHLRLWNMTVGYMRSDGEFSIDYYADNLLANYHPEDGLDMAPWIMKVRELPEKYHFDRRFTKVPKVIKSKIKQEYELTNDIKLTLSEHIPNIERVIKAYVDDEENKYIMIRSEVGYNLANSIQHEG